jgi:hypothetical protein
LTAPPRADTGPPQADTRLPRADTPAHLYRGLPLALLLALILIAGGGLRIAGHNWDQDQQLSPDENDVTQATLDQVRLPPGTNLGQLLDPVHSPLNLHGYPAGFHYGGFFVYLDKVVTHGLRALTGDAYFTGYFDTKQTGRVLSALFDTATILLVFAIGWQIWGAWAGLAAATCYAFAPLPLQTSHYYLSETFMTTFMTATLLASLLLYRRGQAMPAMLAGLAAGLALASKISAAPVMVLPLLAILLRCADWRTAGRLAGWTGLGTLVGLLVGDPFAVLDAPGYLAQIRDQVAIQSGAVDLWFTRPYVGTPPVLYPWTQLALVASGLLVGLAGTVGAIWLALRLRQAGRAPAILLLGGAGAYFASIAFVEAKWIRYLLPLVPYMALFATALGVAVGAWAGRHARLLGPVRLAAAGVLASAVAGGLAFTAIYRADHTRVAASEWIYAHIPAGSTIGIELNDDLMPRPLPGVPPPETAYHIAWARRLGDQPNAEFLSQLRSYLASADYLIVCPVRSARVVPQLPWRYPLQNRYYDLLFHEQLGFTLVHTQTSYPTLLGLRIPDDGPWVDAAFVEYDHPPILIYQKQHLPSDSEWAALFSTAAARTPVVARHAP